MALTVGSLPHGALRRRRTVAAPGQWADGSRIARKEENNPCFCPVQGIHRSKKLSDIVDRWAGTGAVFPLGRPGAEGNAKLL